MEPEEALRRLASDSSDEPAWAALYAWLWPYVFAIAFRELNGATQAAEDAAQETFIRLARYSPFARLTGPDGMRAYAAAMARNAARDLAVREFRRRGVSLEDLPKGQEPTRGLVTTGPLGPMTDADAIAYVRGILNEEERALLDLLIRRPNLESLAKALGIAYESAAVRVYRLRRKIAKLLKERTLGDH
ncbi:MAG TPA: sigma factor [Candidatus Saccharimonadaceae bacterium]|jgi:RNA polymerase sigma factor (sigma-70 family)|nr:sigma factor [Candidatus Saccharimonadaceae bacterium]